MQVEKEYTFADERGALALGELFDDRSQLVVYHAMFNPETAGPNTTWTSEAACFSCSYWMDGFDGITVHLNHRDIALVAVSRAPYPAIASYRRRMGWSFPWLSSASSDFNFDYGVSFTEDELAARRLDYNYGPSTFRLSEALVSACSSRMPVVGSSTRTRPTRAALTCLTSLTTTWTWCRRAGTKSKAASTGCTGTTSTLMVDGARGACQELSWAPTRSADLGAGPAGTPFAVARATRRVACSPPGLTSDRVACGARRGPWFCSANW